MELHNAFKPMLPVMLAAAMLFTAVAATAQPRRPRPIRHERHERHEVRRTPDYDAWRTGPRHEVSIKAGAFPFTMSCGHLGLSTGGGRMPLHSGIFAMPDAVAALKVRYSPRKTFGGITAAYYYRVAYALSVGVAFTYTGLYGDIFDARNGRKVSSNDMATISVAPALRLQWLNLPTVRCYSAIAAGRVDCILFFPPDDCDEVAKPSPAPNSSASRLPALDVMISIVFLKSTVLPLLSVSLPSSRT